MGVEALEEMATKELPHGARTPTRSSQAGHTGVGKSTSKVLMTDVGTIRLWRRR